MEYVKLKVCLQSEISSFLFSLQTLAVTNCKHNLTVYTHIQLYPAIGLFFVIINGLK